MIEVDTLVRAWRRPLSAVVLTLATLPLACSEPAKESTPTPPAGRADEQALIWVDRNGARVGALGVSGRLHAARLSPDGTSVAWLDTNGTVWLRPLTGGEAIALNDGGARGLAWSPDSARLAIDAAQPDSRLLLLRISDRTATALEPTGTELTVDDWSPDGQYITYGDYSPAKKRDIWLLYLRDQTLPVPQVYTDGVDRQAAFSPDSRSMAYTSERDGRPEVFVQPFPVPSLSIRVSYDGGTEPRWSRDGKELFYQAADGFLMSATISPAPSLAVTGTRTLFPLGGTLQGLSADGQRFLVLASSQ